MELGKINRFETPLKICGWISIFSGLIILFIFNIGILTNYETALDDFYSLFIFFSFVFGFTALFSKRSRSLGFWGLSIGLFLILFVAVIFILGWVIVPFP